MANAFGDVAGNLFGNIFSGIIWFGAVLILFISLGSVMYYFLFYKKQFNIRVKVLSERAEDKDRVYFDWAAIMTDRKTKVRYFKIWSLKIELPLVSFNVIQSADGKDYIELYRTSDDKFYFLTPPKIDKKRILTEDGKVIPIAEHSQDLVHTDVSFWNLKRKESNKGMFDTEHWIMKLLPYIPHIIAGVISLFMLYVLLDHLPGILNQLSKLAAELNSYKAAEVITHG